MTQNLDKSSNAKRVKGGMNQVGGGGGGSAFSNLWYSSQISPAELSRITLERIDCAPMFNPLRQGTVFPTGSSGITPTGVYLANIAPYDDSCITVECMGRRPLPNAREVPDADIVAKGGEQTGGGILSNGLAYGPYASGCRCRGPCRCRRGAYGKCGPMHPKRSCGVYRDPVYYSESSSPEGCTSRCRMPPARLASREIGCKSLAEAGVKNVDYETYLHLKAVDTQERFDLARQCYCGKCKVWNRKCSPSRCRPTQKCAPRGCGC